MHGDISAPFWPPTQAGKGIHLAPWEKRFLLMQFNIYVFNAAVCITTASESNFLEVRTAVLSITKDTRPAQAAPQAGLGPGGFQRSPHITHALVGFFFSLFKNTWWMDGVCLPLESSFLHHPEPVGRGWKGARGARDTPAVCPPQKPCLGAIPGC